ncbi:DinB family protein [Pedobacter sp. BG31]|uniref:DinB family protein n=1 Tax=Pedobacter sp. BG31 TaxID=3349697 RepID=UPI0035F454CA
MKTHSQLLLELWQEARAWLTDQLAELCTEDLKKTLSPSPNSVGFLLRHIAEVELLFAKNVFKAPGITVHAATLIAKHDTDEWNNLNALKDFLGYAFESLKEIIEIQVTDYWEQSVTTAEFGIKTRAETLGRIASHTAYHAGQLAMVLKYGK